MEAKKSISAQYSNNEIDIENISSDFSKLLGVNNSLRNVSRKNDSLIGLIFTPKNFMVGQYSLHIQSKETVFLSFKSCDYKLATNELIRLELKIKTVVYHCTWPKLKKYSHQFIERNVYPEKHFEQVSINNDLFSGVIKWQSNSKPSWTKPEVDQWRFELRFDEVIAEYMYVK